MSGLDFPFLPGSPERNRRLDPETIEHWVVPLDVPPATEEAARALLSAEERARADRFVFARDRRRHTIAHAAMRVLLSAYTGSAPGDIRFATLAHGKPVLETHTGLHFNLSHSGERALLGVTTLAEIGVDIEFRRVVADRDAIARSYFAAGEYRALEGLASDLRDLGFFLCWTRKEAYVKAVGDGISLGLDRFEVTLEPGTAARFLTLDGSAEAAAAWSLHQLDPAPGYVGATAIRGHPKGLLGWTFDTASLAA
ncbi:MAG TPA: 4'-phosphopantetheinyl transferase superfamily protein [Stellaceae bacterium]